MQAESVPPFTADYDEVKVARRSDGAEETQRQDGRIYRDGRGRMRTEFVDDDGSTVAMLWDPLTGKGMAIDVSTGDRLDVEAEHTPSPRGRRPLRQPGDSERYRPVETSSLGQKDIEGLSATGHRVRLADGTVSETWHTSSLPDRPILSLQTGPSGREEFKLTNVRIGEPDPELFRPLDAAGK